MNSIFCVDFNYYISCEILKKKLSTLQTTLEETILVSENCLLVIRYREGIFNLKHVHPENIHNVILDFDFSSSEELFEFVDEYLK